jgi:hypothetical protein
MDAISFSAASLTFFFWSALAPSASRAASSSSSFQALATRASRRSPRFLISRRRFASWVGRSRWRASSSTEITMYAAK